MTGHSSVTGKESSNEYTASARSVWTPRGLGSPRQLRQLLGHSYLRRQSSAISARSPHPPRAILGSVGGASPAAGPLSPRALSRRRAERAVVIPPEIQPIAALTADQAASAAQAGLNAALVQRTSQLFAGDFEQYCEAWRAFSRWASLHYNRGRGFELPTIGAVELWQPLDVGGAHRSGTSDSVSIPRLHISKRAINLHHLQASASNASAGGGALFVPASGWSYKLPTRPNPPFSDTSHQCEPSSPKLKRSRTARLNGTAVAAMCD
eukprot:SAG31_NODE_7434_length_1689_cov_1.840881_1_plen_265_part_10